MWIIWCFGGKLEILKLFHTQSLEFWKICLIFGVYLQKRKSKKMSRRDDITGRKAMNGYRSSKANNKTKHRFHLNLQKRRFYVPEEDKWITLKVSTKTLKTINKKGITEVLKDARKKGTLLKQV